MTAKRVSRDARHHCLCGHRAVYRRRRGRVTAHGDHPLCARCWRSERDRTFAAQNGGWGAARLVLPRGIVLPLAAAVFA
jgi:hypothetical protein